MARLTALLLALATVASAAFAADPLVVGDVVVERGETATGGLRVGGPDGANTEAETVLPITVVRGARPGPTLLLLAGVHGSEYVPIVSLQQLMPSLDPSDIAGTVIAVHVANPPTYLGQAGALSPVDGENLNRVFPGDPDGTLTARIASAITTELFPLADAVLDLHGGNGLEDLEPSWTGYYANAPTPEVAEANRAIAFAFGLSPVVEFQWEVAATDKAIWAGSQAVARGIPSIDVEAGGLGQVDPDEIAAVTEGIRRIMAHLQMTDEAFAPLPEPILIKERAWVEAPAAGSWTARAEAGDTVEKGQLLGIITDVYGGNPIEVRAPMAGLVLILREAPPVRKGHDLSVIAKIEM